jgi:hypothetical protein
LCDIGLAYFGVVHWKVPIFDSGFAAGNLNDPLSKLFDRHFHRVAKVNRTVILAGCQPEYSFDQIGDVTEASGLASIAKYCQRLVI